MIWRTRHPLPLQQQQQQFEDYIQGEEAQKLELAKQGRKLEKNLKARYKRAEAAASRSAVISPLTVQKKVAARQKATTARQKAEQERLEQEALSEAVSDETQLPVFRPKESEDVIAARNKERATSRRLHDLESVTADDAQPVLTTAVAVDQETSEVAPKTPWTRVDSPYYGTLFFNSETGVYSDAIPAEGWMVDGDFVQSDTVDDAMMPNYQYASSVQPAASAAPPADTDVQAQTQTDVVQQQEEPELYSDSYLKRMAREYDQNQVDFGAEDNFGGRRRQRKKKTKRKRRRKKRRKRKKTRRKH